MILNKVLPQLGMTMPNHLMQDAFNQELKRKKQYYCDALRESVRTNTPLLNRQQKYKYDHLMKVMNDKTGGIFFLDAPDGTGKTFLNALILTTIRSQNEIVFAFASSGISATLLEGGLTVHSALKLPFNTQINETLTCNLPKNCAMIKILQQSKFIV